MTFPHGLCILLCLTSAEASTSWLRGAFQSTSDAQQEDDRILQNAVSSLKDVGNNGRPAKAFPLGLCQGDCDSDGECAEHLVCYHGPSSTVPGCSGKRSQNRKGKMANYCYSIAMPDPTPEPTPKPKPLPTPPPVSTPKPTPEPTLEPTPTPKPLPTPPPVSTPKPTPRPTKPQPYCNVEFKDSIDKTKDLVNIRIFEIQGRDRTSPYVGQLVYNVPGIVTAINGNRFFFQDLVGDGRQQTSDAVEVFGQVPVSLSIGDLVIVDGQVQEIIPPLNDLTTRMLSKTQIVPFNIDLVASGYRRPPPVYLGMGGRMPPTQNMGDGLLFWSSLEAMLVVLPKPLAVTPTLLGDPLNNLGGDFFAVGDLGQHATGLSERKTVTVRPDDFNPEKIKINEYAGILDFEYPVVEAGDELSDVTGVIEYTPALPIQPFGNPDSFQSAAYYQITPTKGFRVVKATGNQPTKSSCKLDKDTTAVATYNLGQVELGNQAELDRTANIIVDLMGSPDVIALQGVDNLRLPDLVQAVEDKPGPTYTILEQGSAGGAPGVILPNVFLYNAKNIDLIPNSAIQIDFNENGIPFGTPSLAATFKFTPTARVFLVVNNDWYPKYDPANPQFNSAPSLGTLQPFEKLQEDTIVNGGLSRRLIQSNTVRDFIAGRSDVIVLGNFNEYQFVSPITNLEYTGLKNLVYDFHPNERYSYIFEGNSVAFDQILVTHDFCPCAKGQYIRVNSEFAGTTAALSDPYHDPMVACIDIKQCK